MRPTTTARCAFLLLGLAWCAAGSGSAPALGQEVKTDKPRKEETADATTIRPVRVDVLSLQVSKLPRNQFGQGIKPGTNENVAFWLAASSRAACSRYCASRVSQKPTDAPRTRSRRTAASSDNDTLPLIS